MPKFIDRTGMRYGRLTAQQVSGKTATHKLVWECRCDCGKTAHVVAGSLATGNTVSCGCYLHERITKHGGWKCSSYNTWRAMMRRCYVPTDKDFKRYGAVGITVHAPWHEYTNFATDMGEPIGKDTLDRVDAYGNYTPANSRWASPTTQARNIRVRKSSVSGHTGVYPTGSKWIAAITCGRKRYYSPVTETIEQALIERKKLETLHWGQG